MSAELLAVAERVERSEKPSVDLYREVYFAVNGPKPDRVHGGSTELTHYLNRYNPYYSLITHGGWLEAAMTLVPEGWDWAAGGKADYGWAYTNNRELHFIGVGTRRNPGHRWFDVRAATPALALTAAALRAHAALAERKDQAGGGEE